jgi:hypothetical protein
VPRKTAEPPSVHTTLRIPGDLHDQLAKAAGEQGISEEIRRQLETAVALGNDPKTRELLVAIADAADELAANYFPWHDNRFAFDVFQSAIVKLLARDQPSGEPVPKTNPEGFADVVFEERPRVDDIANFVVGVAIGRGKGR